MNERELLIELLNGAVNHYAFITRENLADYLLSHGVKIPVRCEDCKHNDKKKALREGGNWCRFWGIDPDYNDYCSCGERKNDNG